MNNCGKVMEKQEICNHLQIVWIRTMLWERDSESV